MISVVWQAFGQSVVGLLGQRPCSHLGQQWPKATIDHMNQHSVEYFIHFKTRRRWHNKQIKQD